VLFKAVFAILVALFCMICISCGHPLNPALM